MRVHDKCQIDKEHYIQAPSWWFYFSSWGPCPCHFCHRISWSSRPHWGARCLWIDLMSMVRNLWDIKSWDKGREHLAFLLVFGCLPFQSKSCFGSLLLELSIVLDCRTVVHKADVRTQSLRSCLTKNTARINRDTWSVGQERCVLGRAKVVNVCMSVCLYVCRWVGMYVCHDVCMSCTFVLQYVICTMCIWLPILISV